MNNEVSLGDRQVVKTDVSSGLFETIAGGGDDTFPISGDAATSSQLSPPAGVAMDTAGRASTSPTAAWIEVLAGGRASSEFSIEFWPVG